MYCCPVCKFVVSPSGPRREHTTVGYVSSFTFCVLRWPRDASGYVEMDPVIWEKVKALVWDKVGEASLGELEDAGWVPGDEEGAEETWREQLRGEILAFLEEALVYKRDDCVDVELDGVRFLITGGDGEYGDVSESYQEMSICALLGLFKEPI